MTPRRPSKLSVLLAYWPLITTGAALVAGLITAVVSLQAQRDQLQRQLEEGCQRIEVLERLFVGEFPAYSPALYYLHAPTC